MPAPVTTKNNKEEISDRWSSHRDARISPSLPTPLPLEHVLMPYGFPKKGDQPRPSKALPSMGTAEMESILQSALDIGVPSEYWSYDEGAQ
jgi:hypothetical protein